MGAESADEGKEVGLTSSESRAYRMLAARLNYMAQDQPFMQLSAKEACRSMTNLRSRLCEGQAVGAIPEKGL